MARAAGAVDTAAKRAKLAARKNPYWHGVSGGRGGVSLGYRKPARGAGTWIAKIVVDGERLEERLGAADDIPLDHALPYQKAVTEALEWGRRQFAGIEARQAAEAPLKAPTVRSAVESYIDVRVKRSRTSGGNARSRLTQHVLSATRLADTKLSRLSARMLQDWRETLPADLTPSSVNRLMSDFRAALNAAVEARRRELPAHLAGEIRAGLKKVEAPVEARRQLLTDADVRSLVEAALSPAVDPGGDFGRFVLLAAATGARFSQIARMRVADVQPRELRVMVPTSQKGRGKRKATHTAVPIGADVLERLLPALNGRKGHEPLLTRWHHQQTGPRRWERHERRAWIRPDEIEGGWAASIQAAGLPSDTVMYALRHSSIVRGLRAGLPVRLVAALHDTSVEMIEAHYAAFIVDMTEELARRAIVPLAPQAPTPLRVVGAAE